MARSTSSTPLSVGSVLVLLGTGGTIAGTSSQPDGQSGYRAAQLGVDALLAGVPRPPGMSVEVEQVAQLDSKDMDHATWQHLAQRCAHHLARPEVAGLVVTHGTDTLEETAWFLQRVLAPAKPLVLTAAMRPATALQADGPQNLADAMQLAGTQCACGVLVVMAGAVHGAREVRKVHTYRLDAFSSGDAGTIAHIEAGQLRRHRDWPQGEALGLARIAEAPAEWPRVEIMLSHAGASAGMVQALVADGVRGLVVAAPGNGSVHQALIEALRLAQAAGVTVWRTTRSPGGVLTGHDHQALPGAPDLSPWQARIELMLHLLDNKA
ncbi:MAG: asparaginase [Burkholderiales bacterium]